MALDEIQSYIQRADELRAERSTWDRSSADIADIFRPIRSELRNGNLTFVTEGQKRLGNVFDGAGILAAQHLGGFIYSTISNPANDWLRFGTMDRDLNDWYPVKLYFESCSRRVLASAQPSFSGFYAQAAEIYMDQPCFGTSVFSSELREDRSGFNDQCLPMSECWFDVDAENRPNAMYRRWMVGAAAAARMYGGEKLSTRAQDLARDKPNEKIELMRVVAPNDEYSPGRFGPKGKPFKSLYIEVAEQHEIRRAGYEEFPYQVPRWALAAGEKMGRGHPGEFALPDGGSLQAIGKANLMAAEWAASPPWGAPDDGVISTMRLRPNGVSFGAMNRQGQQLLKPLLEGGSVPVTQEMLEAKANQVKEFFFYSIMLMDPSNRTGIANEEIMERQTERMQVLGPYIVNLTGGFQEPWARRRFAMMARLRLLPPPPRELQGHVLQVGFTSPLAQAQKAQEASGVLRSWNFVAEQASLDPGIIDIWKGEEAVRIVHDALGGPTRVLQSPEAFAQLRAQRQQQAQVANATALALPAAQAAQHGVAALAQLRAAQNQQPSA